MSSAGRRDRRVTFEAPLLVEGQAEDRYDYVEIVTVWGSRAKARAGEQLRAAQTGATITHRVEVLWCEALADLDPTWRLVCGGEIYGVTEVNELGRRAGFEIFATARAEKPA